MKYLLVLLLLLAGCSKKDNEDNMNYCGVESLGEWDEIEWKHTITDDTDDFVFHGGDVGPDPIYPYKSSDIIEAKFSYDDNFVYIMFRFDEPIPTDSQEVEVNGETLYVHSQAMNIAIDFDPSDTQDTGSMWGIDTFFAMSVNYYNQCIEAYAPYEFSSTDIHSMTATLYGDSHPDLGGFGTDYVIARYPIELIKDRFDNEEFEVFGWAEAAAYREEKFEHFLEERFHEFVHDDLETTYYKKST